MPLPKGLRWVVRFSYLSYMRMDKLIRIWEESHESLRDRPWLRYEFKMRKEAQEVLRYSDDDITRTVAQKKRLKDILILLKSTSQPLPNYSPELKPKEYDPTLRKPAPEDDEISDEELKEWQEWRDRHPLTYPSPEETAELYNKESS